MTRTSRIAITISSLALALALAVGLAHPAAAQVYVPSEETKMIGLVNTVRAAKGLKKLAAHDELRSMARGQADRMEAKGNIFHNIDLGGDITSRGLEWLRVGENVGMGPSLILIHEALLDSPKHYENIVRPEYNSVGIGVVDGDDGRRYVVQVFGNIKGAVAPAPAPAKPAVVAPATPKPVVAVAPAATAPVATPKPAPRPSAEPNALTGGYVNLIELPLSDLGKYTTASAVRSDSGFGRLIDALTFWS
jgi:uncharacterized protein YkwD